MIKKGTGFNDIYNYRNSKHFIKTVNEARMWKKNGKDLAIFAGACQSFYEAIMQAGANFASSPRKNYDRFYRSFNCGRKNCNNREYKISDDKRYKRRIKRWRRRCRWNRNNGEKDSIFLKL